MTCSMLASSRLVAKKNGVQFFLNQSQPHQTLFFHPIYSRKKNCNSSSSSFSFLQVSDPSVMSLCLQIPVCKSRPPGPLFASSSCTRHFCDLLSLSPSVLFRNSRRISQKNIIFQSFFLTIFDIFSNVKHKKKLF